MQSGRRGLSAPCGWYVEVELAEVLARDKRWGVDRGIGGGCGCCRYHHQGAGRGQERGCSMHGTELNISPSTPLFVGWCFAHNKVCGGDGVDSEEGRAATVHEAARHLWVTGLRDLVGQAAMDMMIGKSGKEIVEMFLGKLEKDIQEVDRENELMGHRSVMKGPELVDMRDVVESLGPPGFGSI
ncbi:uncharacterized protein A4U43_C10F6720 [Asparagus officinalis]|uniref:Uncharacterized protein n=1 Tax=Asparagus officinalis TaxID=4686 RepID=A0A5P1E168_ASPOF|nr:uncharacterized protein A4U43_C10F6720 [Asparagus officinalis]